jgi:hypothetical protein
MILDDDSDDERLTKTGAELFRELLRIYPVAEVEDYLKMGSWKNELMKTDLQLVEAHRREAGAGESPPLEEVKLPASLKMTPIKKPELSGLGMSGISGIKPVAAGLLTPTSKPGNASATSPAGATTTATSTNATNVAAPLAELRVIALFVAKFKMDPTRTKMTLAKLTPQRRRYVMQTFTCTESGGPASNALEKFLAECEQTNAWDSEAATTSTSDAAPAAMKPGPLGAATGPAATLLTAGAKRPMMGTPLVDFAKRPRVVPSLPGPVAVGPLATNPAAAALAAKIATARARAPTPGACNPLQVRPPVAPMGRPMSPMASAANAWGRPAGFMQRF